MQRAVLSTLIVGLVAFSSFASADSVTFTGGTGEYAAEADFTVLGGQLYLTLTNSATVPSSAPGSTLTGVNFNLAHSSPVLSFSPSSSLSAKVTAGSSVYYNNNGKWALFTDAEAGTDPGNTFNSTGNVGGEWGYATGNAGYGYNIISSGYYSATQFDPSQNLSGPVSLDGLQFGLISGSTATVNATVQSNFTGSNNTPLVSNSTTFDLGNFSGSGLSTLITGVQFLYGTNPDHSETGTQQAAPAPSSGFAAMALLASLGGGCYLRMRRAGRDIPGF
jgi:hypothetical protein